MNVAYIEDDEYFESQKPSFLSNLKPMYSKHRVLTWIVISVFVLSFIPLIILCRCTAKEKALQKDPGDIAAGLPTSLSSMKSSKKASNNSVNAKGSKTITASSRGSTKPSKKKSTKSFDSGNQSPTGGNTSTPSQSSRSVSPSSSGGNTSTSTLSSRSVSPSSSGGNTSTSPQSPGNGNQSSTGGNTSTSPQSPGNGNPSPTGGNTSTSSLSSAPVPTDPQKNVDEIVKLVRSNTTKFNNAELNKALNINNELLEVVITECTKNAPDNGTVSGEAILKLMLCANDTQRSTAFDNHFRNTIVKTYGPFNKPAEKFWNVNLDDATSGISSSERAMIVYKLSVITVRTMSSADVCKNLIDSFAKTNVPPFTGKLWYEYVINNINAEEYAVHTLLNKLNEAIDSKEQFLQIDELFERIQEKDMFGSLWGNRVANSFMDYLIRKKKVKQSYLFSYMENVFDAKEKESRFSNICTLITDLNIYKKIAAKIRLGYGKSYTSIPIFDIEKLSKDANFVVEQRNLFTALVDFGFDSMLRNSMEKLNDNKRLFLNKFPYFDLQHFPLTKDFIFKICETDVMIARNFLEHTSDINRVNFLKGSNLSDYSEIITLSMLDDEMLKIIDAKENMIKSKGTT